MLILNKSEVQTRFHIMHLYPWMSFKIIISWVALNFWTFTLKVLIFKKEGGKKKKKKKKKKKNQNNLSPEKLVHEGSDVFTNDILQVESITLMIWGGGGGGILKANFFFCIFFFVDWYCFYPGECASPVYYRKKKQQSAKNLFIYITKNS